MIIEHGYQEPQRSTLDRARILIIGAVIVLAAGVGVVLGGVLVAGSSLPLARAASFVPADAVLYAEASLHLPGSQQANLRALLERFPAADADAVLTEALADTLDDALADADAPFDYSSDVAPWFDGTLAFAMLDYPLNADPASMALPSLVGMFGVRDAPAAAELLETLRAEAGEQGSTFTSSEHAGVTIWALEVEPDPSVPVQNLGFAYALADDQLLLANGAETIRAALDAVTGDNLAGADAVGPLLSALPAERAGTMVVNSAAMVADMRAELESAQPGLAEALAVYLDGVPAYSVGSLAFGDDAFLFDGASSLSEGPLRPENATRTFAARLPSDTLFYADGSGFGPALEQGILAGKASVAIMPGGDQALSELEGVEAALGADLEEFVSWIGDGAMAAGWTGEAPWFGLVLEATDVDAAGRRLSQIGALAELAAGQGGMGVEVTTESVNEVEVTTVTFVGDPAGFGMPAEFQLQYALDADDALAFIGLGDRFVGDALTMPAGGSLAASERYESAIARFGGDENTGAFFLDLAGLSETIRVGMPLEDTGAMQELWENLAPLDYLAGVTRVDGDRVISRLGVVLR